MEASGYALLALLLAFVIYSYFRRLPIIAGATGTATATLVAVTAAEDTAVLAAEATHEQRLAKGQRVLEVTDDPVDVGILRVRAALRDPGHAGSQASGEPEHARWARVLDSGLFTIKAEKTLVAPSDGWLVFPDGKPPSGWVPKGATLFSVADFRSLTVTVEIPKEQRAKRVALGQPAKVWFTELAKEPVPAQIVKLVPGGPDLPEGKVATIEAFLAGLPERARARARQDYFGGAMKKKWRPAVAITVGQQRLLNQIRTPPDSQ
jgi:hypothetical protein